MELNKEKLLRLRVDKHAELYHLFAPFGNLQHPVGDEDHHTWLQFVESTLKSDFGRFKSFQLYLNKLPFDGPIARFEELFKLINDPFYMNFAKTDEFGDQVKAVVQFLEAYQRGVSNHSEISSMVEKINEITIDDLSKEEREKINMKNENIKKSEQMIEFVKMKIGEELQAMDDDKTLKLILKNGKISDVFQTLVNIFFSWNWDLREFLQDKGVSTLINYLLYKLSYFL